MATYTQLSHSPPICSWPQPHPLYQPDEELVQWFMEDHKAGPVREGLLWPQQRGRLGGRVASTNAPQPFSFHLGCRLLALHPVGEAQPQDLFLQARHDLRGNAIRFFYSQILWIWEKGSTDKVREPYLILGDPLSTGPGPRPVGLGRSQSTPQAPWAGISRGPAHLVPGLCWCADGETQAKNHAWGLGDDADHVEGGGRLVWGTGEKWESVSSPSWL